jgi:hypothetical protein
MDERSDVQGRRDPIDRVPGGVGRSGMCRSRGVFSFSLMRPPLHPVGRDKSGPYAHQCKKSYAHPVTEQVHPIEDVLHRSNCLWTWSSSSKLAHQTSHIPDMP